MHHNHLTEEPTVSLEAHDEQGDKLEICRMFNPIGELDATEWMGELN